MVQPSSVDVRIDRYFRLFDNHRYAHIDPAEEQPELTRMVEVDPTRPSSCTRANLPWLHLRDRDAAGQRCRPPGGQVLAGRLGLLTHSTAGFIDPGFSGHITLELSNVATLPIKLWPGMKIGQLCFFQLSSPAENPYGPARTRTATRASAAPRPPAVLLNFHRTDI